MTAALTALLAGCVGYRVPAPAPETTVVTRSVVEAFELKGRLSATDGTQAASGQLHWRHAPQTDEWTVLSPLGQIVAQLTRTAQGAQLITADGKRLDAPDARTLLPQILGASAPIDGLRYWIQATPRPDASVLQFDHQGRPGRIADDGWIIDYITYTSDAPDSPPRRIDAHRGETLIRLIIDQWTPQP